MGKLIAIEGLDGAGKNTLARQLQEKCAAAGQTVGVLSFPRYGHSVHADLVRDALYERLGDVGDSVYATALLFALDRRSAQGVINDLLDQYNIVLLDRYIASNAAYGAARLGGLATTAGRDFPAWVAALEVERFSERPPDRHLLLATPAAMAAQRARGRAAELSHRALDSFERDDDLQARTAAMYQHLAAREFLAPWTVLTPAADGSLTLPDNILG